MVAIPYGKVLITVEPPFTITDDLIDDFEDDVENLHDKNEFANFSRSDGEERFIKKAIRELDGAQGQDGNLSIHLGMKEYHQSPIVKFWWPGEEKFKGCELADFLFIITYVNGSGVAGRRTMISQAKHSYNDKYKTQLQWDCAPYQYYLLHWLPKFYPTKPDLEKWYKFPRKSRAFTNYSFASDFWLPFFHSTWGMTNRHIDADKHQDTKYRYERTNDFPVGFQYFTGYLKLFMRGKYGQPFKRTDPVGEFYEDLFASDKDFDEGGSPDKVPTASDLAVPDGGASANPEDEGPPPENDGEYDGLSIINIVIGDGAEFHSERPGQSLYLGENQSLTLSDL